MLDKVCDNCKWFRPWAGPDVTGNCMNPLNDRLHNHFNNSTGDYIYHIRRALEVDPSETCFHYAELKKKAAK